MKDSNEELNKIVSLPNVSKEVDALIASFSEDKAVAAKLRSLGLTRAQVKANLGLISAYKDDCDYCARCPGLKGCAKDVPFHKSDLVLTEGRLDRTYGPCELYLREQMMLGSYLYRDFPDEWLDLETKKLSNSIRVQKVMLALMKASNSPSKPWVYLTGAVGSGRSYLTVAFANGYALSGKKVAFLNANKRFDELKGLAVQNKKAFDARMDELQKAPLLVVDDFGSEYKSDYVRDQIVMPLLAERAKNNLLTIFLSDYSLDEIKELYSSTRSSGILARRMVELIQSKIEGETIVEKGLEAL